MKTILMAAVAAGLCLSSAGTASAADGLNILGYDLNMSVQAAAASSYQGSKHYSFFPSVNVALTKPWQFDDFSAPDDSATFALYSNGRFAFGPAASIIADRGDSHALKGMRNLGWALEGGGYADYWPTNWVRLHGEVLRGLTAEDGLLVNTAVDFVKQLGPLRLSGGPRFAVADDHYDNTYFGVTPLESAASPRFKTPYTAKAGPLSGGLEAAAEYKLRSRWRLTLNANYDRLLSNAADSPIVRITGSPDQFSVGAGVRFMVGG